MKTQIQLVLLAALSCSLVARAAQNVPTPASTAATSGTQQQTTQVSADQLQQQLVQSRQNEGNHFSYGGKKYQMQINPIPASEMPKINTFGQ